MTKFDLENFKNYLSKNPEKEEGKTWKFRENSGYSEKKFLIEATDYSEFGTISETEKLKFDDEDLTEKFFDDQNSLIKKVLKEYLKQKDQEEEPRTAETLIFSPLVKSDFQSKVDAVDKNINFYCRGLNYEGGEIQTIILDAKNARDDVVGHYLAKKCLLEFNIYNEIKKTGETTLFFSDYRLSGFFRGSLTFKVLKVKEGYNNTLKIEVVENLFNSSSKTLLLSKNNKQVKKVILDKKKSRERNDKETGADILETDWSEVEGKTFTIGNINGEKCYFEKESLVLNDFGGIIEGEKSYREGVGNNSNEDIIITTGNASESEAEEIKETIENYQELLNKYKIEIEKNKQLLAEKEQLVEESREKEDLIQQLNQANQKIKELEEYSTATEKQLRELYDYAKNGSSSSSAPPKQPNNSNLKIQLTKLQAKHLQLQQKLAEEQKRSQDLISQIRQLKNSTNSTSLWQTIIKPVIIGGIAIGVVLLLLLIYKYWKKFF